MKLEDIKPHIVEIFQKQGIEKALEELKNLIHKNSSVFREIILLQDRRKRNEEKNRQGVISNDDYNRETNQLVNSFLQLLDYVNENDLEINITYGLTSKSEKFNKDNFDIERALEWLKERLKSLLYQQTHFVENGVNFISTRIKEVEFKNQGEFKFFFEWESSQIRKPKGLITTIKENFSYEGRFCDISEVKIEVDYYVKGIDTDDEFNLVCFAYNRRDLFLKKYNNKQSEEGKVSRFNIQTNDETLANRLKKAIDDISIYYGRKHEMY